MDLWILSAAMAVGFQGGSEAFGERHRMGSLIAWLIVGGTGIAVGADVDLMPLALWFMLSGVVLVFYAMRKLTRRVGVPSAWGSAVEVTAALMALWFVSADWLTVGVGAVAGVGLAAAAATWRARYGELFRQWEILSVGAVGLEDIRHAWMGQIGAPHFDPLWMVPWLLMGELRLFFFDDYGAKWPTRLRLVGLRPKNNDLTR
ncbi:MAG: hypothetical protein ACYCOU_20385 [Sulfobacillus sp.]